MLASGGWYLPVIAVPVYCGVLVAGSRVFASLSKYTSSILAVVLVYWAFYIHRNDLFYELTFARRVLLGGVSEVALSILLGLAARVWLRAADSASQVRHEAGAAG